MFLAAGKVAFRSFVGVIFAPLNGLDVYKLISSSRGRKQPVEVECVKSTHELFEFDFAAGFVLLLVDFLGFEICHKFQSAE